MIQKAVFLTIVKGKELTLLLIKENKKVFMCFGDDNWFNFQELRNLKGLSYLKPSAKRKYEEWINSKKFKKDYKETEEVIENAVNYEEIIEKFIKDFKKDRGNRIWRNDTEIDDSIKQEDIQYEYKR
ncbi:MAG TPA: hypothetical protein VJ895_02680 [Candidatus Nanoarchaeia archaeon]|nr:hypothetical protein [Candidatus Nanoarchaeia archaeon]